MNFEKELTSLRRRLDNVTKIVDPPKLKMIIVCSIILRKNKFQASRKIEGTSLESHNIDYMNSS